MLSLFVAYSLCYFICVHSDNCGVEVCAMFSICVNFRLCALYLCFNGRWAFMDQHDAMVQFISSERRMDR